MNSHAMKWLGIVAAVLIAGVIAMQFSAQRDASETPRLLPSLESQLNAIQAVSISSGDDAVTLRRSDDRWVVAQRDDYPADVGRLRSELLALAEAETIEAKTRNPDLHERLGLAGPDATTVTLTAADDESVVVLGNTAQQNYRYARRDDEEQTWLINRNPALDADPAGWLLAELIDIPSAEVVSGSITHADGETIQFARNADDDSSFDVLNIPDGRELSYASIINSVPNALSNLELDDVRRAGDETATTTTEFRLEDGLVVISQRFEIDEENWFALTARVEAVSAEPSAENQEEPVNSEANVDIAQRDDEQPAVSPGERADDLNDRAGGWLFKLPSYKADQLTKRWDDLLKAPPTEDG